MVETITVDANTGYNIQINLNIDGTVVDKILAMEQSDAEYSLRTIIISRINSVGLHDVISDMQNRSKN